MISFGIEQLITSPPAWIKGLRLGLLCNQASVNSQFIHSKDLIAKHFPRQLRCLFSPQHGYYSEKQDNMIESDHTTDSSGLPIYSLYGDLRKPDNSMFDDIDALLVDIMDVGTRVYTYMSTLAYCMETAIECNKKIIILDRPNPVGGEIVEGNILSKECTSFVGLYPLPMRHGMTFGELALFINDQLPRPVDLHIVKMKGWQRQMLYSDINKSWVYPSPNLPTFLSAQVYPGQVIWEGTNISEGRGTTLPFEIFGAPFLNHNDFWNLLEEKLPAGCIFRPVCFEPTSNKWQNQICNGFQIHITDANTFKPYLSSLLLLQIFSTLYPDQFKLKDTPYEYEFDKVPLDLIIGDSTIRENILKGDDLYELESGWHDELNTFNQLRKQYFLY